MANFAPDRRFRGQTIRFANASTGQVLDVPSANPTGFHQAISASAGMEAAHIDGQLFLPPNGAGRRHPCVIVTPGSLGISPSHVTHAETLTDQGIAAFVLDPFGPRGVSSTVANQTLFSFAASAYDVLAVLRVLATHPAIDPARIGAQGHSRGGSAVMSAATERFAAAVLPGGPRLSAILAAYPWCGQQFLDPSVGKTEVCVLMGDADGWCSAQQAQGHVQAIRLCGGKAHMRIFPGAAHSFDRGTPVQMIENASVAPFAPTGYIADNGAFIHPLTGVADPALKDRDLMVYALKAGYGAKGATIGSNPGDAEAFRDDMVAFWRRVMLG